MGPVKNVASKNVATKKAPAKKAAAKRAPAKKVATKKAVVAKKAAVKKAAVKKPAVGKAPAKKVAAGTRQTAASKVAAWNETKRATEPLLPPVVSTPAPLEETIALTPPPRRRDNTRIAVIAAAVLALLGIAGGAFALTRDPAPSKKAYLAKADALCLPANGPVSAIVKPTSYPELATAVGTVVSTTNSQLEQLGKLRRPGGADGRALEPTFTALTAASAGAKALQDAANRKDDVTTSKTTNDMANSYVDAHEAAKAYGFANCAVGMQTGFQSVTAGAGAVVKAGFVAKADAACRAGARKLESLREPSASREDIARYMGQGLEIVNGLTAELKALPVPPGDETTVRELLDAVDKGNAKLGEMRDAAMAGDEARFFAADRELSTLSTAADAKLDAYGLGVCGSNFGNL